MDERSLTSDRNSPDLQVLTGCIGLSPDSCLTKTRKEGIERVGRESLRGTYDLVTGGQERLPGTDVGRPRCALHEVLPHT